MDTPRELIIFHAGSLSAPFKEIATQFTAENPGVNVMLEAAGSVDCARKITELNKPCDLMASSDYNVIEKFLIPEFATWHIPFAANEMVIAFNGNSLYNRTIDSLNWPDKLLEPSVRFARSDPSSDPCGYRTLMVFQLAEKRYGRPGLAKQLSEKDNKYIRPKEVDLIALLEVGEIDYIFIYRSVAIQHQLKFVPLPDEINLKNPALSSLYAGTSVSIPGNQPGDSVTIHGEPMVYSVTMVKDAPNAEIARAFLEFLLNSEKGMKVMERMGQASVIPSKSMFYSEVPETLKRFVSIQD